MHRRRPERAPRNEAQDQRNAPGEGDEHRGPTASEQRVLPQHPKPPLQLEKRPAMRSQIFPDPARLVLGGVGPIGDNRAARNARHIPKPSKPASDSDSRVNRARQTASVMDGRPRSHKGRAPPSFVIPTYWLDPGGSDAASAAAAWRRGRLRGGGEGSHRQKSTFSSLNQKRVLLFLNSPNTQPVNVWSAGGVRENFYCLDSP
jgi:hypothetical protein